MDSRAKHMLESTTEQTMTPETAMEAGTKFGQHYKSVVVFRDADPSSEMIMKSLVSGLLSVGAKVTDAGMIPVPVAHTAFSSGYDCLLSVGNPDGDGEICGIKAYFPDGTPFDSDQIYDIMKKTDVVLPSYHEVETVSKNTEACEKYIERIKNTGLKSTGFIVVDCNCESTSECAPQLLNAIGAEVIAFNTHKHSGQLPRSPGLNKTDLMGISNIVNASIGSVGVAFNGDGTRLALMDESGKYVPGDRLLAIMLMFLEPTTAVIPFDSPCVVEDAFKHPLGLKKNVDRTEERRLIRCKNNLDDVIQTMKESGADFGALNDGTFIFSSMGYCPDALYASVIISELAGMRSLRNVLEEIPIYSNRTLRIDFDGNMTHFSNKLKEKIKEYEIDVQSSGNAWKMILKQGTYTIKQNELNPKKLVIFAESSDLVYLITMLEQARDIVNYCV
ncbi:MAG: phosphomannomutase [archaeon]|nr:phosphomannomutase [archaeon]